MFWPFNQHNDTISSVYWIHAFQYSLLTALFYLCNKCINTMTFTTWHHAFTFLFTILAHSCHFIRKLGSRIFVFICNAISAVIPCIWKLKSRILILLTTQHAQLYLRSPISLMSRSARCARYLIIFHHRVVHDVHSEQPMRYRRVLL